MLIDEGYYNEMISEILDAAILRVMTQEQFDKVNFDRLGMFEYALESLFGSVFGHKFYFQYIILHKATEEYSEYVYRYLKIEKYYGLVESKFMERLIEDLKFKIVAPLYPIEVSFEPAQNDRGDNSGQTAIITQRMEIGECQSLRAAQNKKVRKDMDESQSN